MMPQDPLAQPDAHSGDLLRRSQTGDGAALDTLLQCHLPGLRAFVRQRMSPLLRARASGSDLVQSACRELLGKIDALSIAAKRRSAAGRSPPCCTSS